MEKLEDIGKRLDEELKHLRHFVENDLGPETEKCTARFLREVSEKLTDAAGWLEARRAERDAAGTKEAAR